MSNLDGKNETAGRTVKTYSVRDFFRRPEKSQFTISPDGRHLSFLTRHAGRQNIFVQALGADGSPLGEARPLTSETERDVPGHAWKGNDRILFVKDFGGDENFHVLSVPIDGGEPFDLTPFDGVRASIVDDLRDDDRHILLQMNRRDPQVFDLFRVDVVTGDFTPIAENPGNVMGWMTDHAGRLRVAMASDGVNTTLLYRDVESDPFRPILTTNFRESVSPLFFTFDDQRLYVMSNRGRDKTAIFEFDPQTAQEGKLLFETEHVDVGGMSYSTHRHVLTAAWYMDDRVHRHFFDDWARAIFDDLERQFPGQEVSVTSITRDESRAIVRVASDLSPGSTWTYDVASRRLSRLAELMPWLDAADMAPMQPIHFAARDGLQINGYLTLPAGIDPAQPLQKPLPLIVNPHGGPWARDTWGFNSEAQLLANRGYAVLQLNFRGSTGYGRAFWEASFGQWGKSMQNDIDDGIEWLVGQGLVDPARVGIYGASYGGYAVLAGVAFTPTRYAAAVDYVGVSNLFTLLESLPPYWQPMIDMMYEMIGNPQTDEGKQALHDASPLFFVDRIVTPLFVAQGANDPRVKQAESDQIVNALRERGVEVKYMLKENEGHGFHNEENQYEFYEAMESFLAQHLGGRTAS
ncbi:dipeptidyl aminopeptidase/acylaminoacyl peptidase [Paraburkholderia sp. GAS199]|uniref:alpha/beta hydrolase family protein n=1 Tax=Paraburkholderia sp. GAS199 TaxID=3035126 RepID=UPI003D1A6421